MHTKKRKKKLSKRYSRSHKRWTKQEDAYLSREWGDITLRRLCENLKRPPSGVRRHATLLGLKHGKAQGLVSMKEAYVIGGFSRAMTHEILRMAKVKKIRHRISTLLGLNTRSPKSSRRPGYRTFMDELDVRMAFQCFIEKRYEPCRQAAARLSVDPRYLKRLALELNSPERRCKQVVMLPRAVWDMLGTKAVRRTRWSDASLNTLRHLVDLRLGRAEIASRMGFSYRAVVSQMQRMRLTVPRSYRASGLWIPIRRAA